MFIRKYLTIYTTKIKSVILLSKFYERNFLSENIEQIFINTKINIQFQTLNYL